MITFAIIFLAAFSLATTVFGVLFASAEAVESLCAILIFAGVALSLGAKVRWGWTMTFLSVLAMVGVTALAPYESAIEIILSAIIAAVGSYRIRVIIGKSLKKTGSTAPVWFRNLYNLHII